MTYPIPYATGTYLTGPPPMPWTGIPLGWTNGAPIAGVLHLTSR